MTKRAFFPARSRLLVGIVLLLVATALTWGSWYSTNAPLDDLAWFERNRGAGDSLAYASAVYHAAYARAAHDNRWSPTGYATLGVIGIVIAGILIVSSRRGRTD